RDAGSERYAAKTPIAMAHRDPGLREYAQTPASAERIRAPAARSATESVPARRGPHRQRFNQRINRMRLLNGFVATVILIGCGAAAEKPAPAPPQPTQTAPASSASAAAALLTADSTVDQVLDALDAVGRNL